MYLPWKRSIRATHAAALLVAEAATSANYCGACWAFSTTGSLEGANAIATGKLVPLSEQEFVDCDTVDQGCGGGLMDNGFKFAEANAICTEKSYPYKGRKGTCQKSSCTVGLAQGSVKGFRDVSPQDTDALMDAVPSSPSQSPLRQTNSCSSCTRKVF